MLDSLHLSLNATLHRKTVSPISESNLSNIPSIPSVPQTTRLILFLSCSRKDLLFNGFVDEPPALRMLTGCELG